MTHVALKNKVDYMTNVEKTTFLINIKLFTYFFFRLSEVGSRGQQIQQTAPSFPFLGRISQLWFGDPKAFLSQVGDVIPPPDPRSASGPPPRWTCLVHLSREAPSRHPTQMPEPPQLTPFDAKEQRLYSESLSDD